MPDIQAKFDPTRLPCAIVRSLSLTLHHCCTDFLANLQRFGGDPKLFMRSSAFGNEYIFVGDDCVPLTLTDVSASDLANIMVNQFDFAILAGAERSWAQSRVQKLRTLTPWCQ